MKQLVIILVVSLTRVVLVAQSEIRIGYTDSKRDHSYPFQKVKLWQGDSLIGEYGEGIYSGLKIKDVANGSYELEYTTIFYQQRKVKIEIPEKGVYTAELQKDYFDYDADPYVPFIDRIQSGEHYTIDMSSSGCFHNTHSELIISREGDAYYSIYGEHTKKLEEDQLMKLRHFEKELNYMKDALCTTSDKYVISYNEEVVRVVDGSCNWNGGSYLKKELGLLKKD